LSKTIRLVEVGRYKWSGDISVPEQASAISIARLIAVEASKHLLSSDVSAIWNQKTRQGTIYVGLGRAVGGAVEV